MTARDVDVVELRPRSRAARDFGLVVGIDDYPRFRSLQGAVADATAFHAWMCDPDGGGVALEHARLVTSVPEPPRPLQDHVDEQLLELAQAADALGGGRRLYVYFSGHGATCTDGAADDVALLLAKWSPNLARLALSSDRYSGALGGLGLFEEVAMFLDCCRSSAVGAVGLPPTFTYQPTRRGAPARAFIAYATEAGRPAFERPDEGVWHGAFTRRLLWILRRSPHGIEAAALKETLERELREEPVQRAHVVNGLPAGSTFGRRGVLPTLEVKPDDEWDSIELFDGMGQLAGSHDPSKGTWTLPLAAGLYKLTYSARGGEPETLKLIDHGRTGPMTLLDLRPRLRESIVRVWSAADADRWIPDLDRMQIFTLSDEPVYIGSSPECVIRAEGTEQPCQARIRCEDGCYLIEDLGDRRTLLRARSGTLFHGRTFYARGALSQKGERIHTKQLRDGGLFRCGSLCLMFGRVEDLEERAEIEIMRFERSIPRSLHVPIPEWLPTSSKLTGSSKLEMRRLLLRSGLDASVTVYDGTGAVRARGEHQLEAELPHGLYRIEAELLDRATSRVIELDDDASCKVVAPEISTPADVMTGEHGRSALPYSVEITSAPLGTAPQTSQLAVLLRLRSPDSSPSGRVSIHDTDGNLLAELSQHISPVRYGAFVLLKRIMAYSCAVAPGTYCLRADRRNIAFTIPVGYTARIFVADAGVVRLDAVRVALVPVNATLNDNHEVARAAEVALAALRSPGRRLSERARGLLRTSIPDDLCFGIAAAHVLGRAEERRALEEVLDALAPYPDIPDVAILQHAYARRAPGVAPPLTAPPLLRASLQLAMTHPAFDLRDVPADSAISNAASRIYTDSVWCTWGVSAYGERWIASTVAELRRGEPDTVALGRRLGIPPRRVQQALDQLDVSISGTAGS
jgi:uncharacterized caspase-like protein